MSLRDIIVIGASAGGIDALAQLTRSFPSDIQAAIFITIHYFGGRDGFLPHLLNQTSPLPAAQAKDGEPIRYGRIYTAPPDYHLTLEEGRVLLSHGPKENMQRPCINAMFRSAASVYGPRTAGVLLTGLLDDGAAGLWEIQQRGGATIVQDPEEAEFRSMPESAVNGLAVQYIVRLAEMGPLLKRLATEDGGRFSAPSREPGRETGAEWGAKARSEAGTKSAVYAQSSGQSCPACGGAMTVSRLGALREYRCHLGHSFGLKTLIAEKRNMIDGSLNVALAQSEELTALLDLALVESSDVREVEELREQFAERKSQQETLRALGDAQK